MEIVKRLEGSEPEEIDYEFEEHCRQEDEKQNRRKKSTSLAFFALILTAIIAYFTFNILGKKELSKPTIESITPTQIVTNSNQSTTANKINKQVIEPSIVEKVKTIVEEENLLPHKVDAKKIIEEKIIEEKIIEKKVVEKKLLKKTPQEPTYTEVLAQEIKPKEIKIDNIQTQKDKPSNIEEEYLKRIKAEALNLQPKKVELTSEKIINTKSTTQVIMKQDKSHNRITLYSTESPHKEKVTLAKPIIKKQKVKKAKPKVVKRRVIQKKSKPKIVKNKRRVITVKKGDTLAILAKRYYGNSMEFKAIVSANKRLKKSTTPLKLGEKLIIPALKKSKTKRVTSKKKTTHKKRVKPKKRRYVTVKKGYSLAYISKKFYGSVNEIKKIVKANKEIKSAKSTLHIGQKIYLPK